MGTQRRATPQAVEALLVARRADEAVALAQWLVADEPGSADHLCLLARACVGAGRNGDALQAARRARAMAPDSAYAARVEAVTQSRLGRQEAAVRAAREAVALDPAAVANHVVLSDVERWADHGLRALAAARRACELAPDEPLALRVYGRAKLSLGDRKDAEWAFRTVLAERPDDPTALDDLADVLVEQGRLGEAFGLYRQAVVQDPAEARHVQLAGRAANRRTAFPYVVAVAALLGAVAGVVGAVVCGVLAGLAVTALDRWRDGRGKLPLGLARSLRDEAGVGHAVTAYRLSLLKGRRVGDRPTSAPQLAILFGVVMLGFAVLTTRLGELGVAGVLAGLGAAAVAFGAAAVWYVRRPLGSTPPG